MGDASKSVSNALHKLYLWDFASYSCFVLMCTLAVCCLGYFWLIPDLNWDVRAILRCGDQKNFFFFFFCVRAEVSVLCCFSSFRAVPTFVGDTKYFTEDYSELRTYGIRKNLCNHVFPSHFWSCLLCFPRKN